MCVNSRGLASAYSPVYLSSTCHCYGNWQFLVGNLKVGILSVGVSLEALHNMESIWIMDQARWQHGFWDFNLDLRIDEIASPNASLEHVRALGRHMQWVTASDVLATTRCTQLKAPSPRRWQGNYGQHVIQCDNIKCYLSFLLLISR